MTRRGGDLQATPVQLPLTSTQRRGAAGALRAALVPDPRTRVVSVDMTGARCETCRKGHYKENPFGGQPDDWRGVLHCDACNTEVERWRERLGERKTGR